MNNKAGQCVAPRCREASTIITPRGELCDKHWAADCDLIEKQWTQRQRAGQARKARGSFYGR